MIETHMYIESRKDKAKNAYSGLASQSDVHI